MYVKINLINLKNVNPFKDPIIKWLCNVPTDKHDQILWDWIKNNFKILMRLYDLTLTILKD